MKLYVRTLEITQNGGPYDSYIDPTSYEFKPTGEFVVVMEDGYVHCYAPSTLDGYHLIPSEDE